VVKRQLAAVIHTNGHCISEIVVAYEPVWAIGTGKTATRAGAGRACRAACPAEGAPPQADRVQILYGGSMNAANAAELLGQPDIDGGLIGGASLKAAGFPDDSLLQRPRLSAGLMNLGVLMNVVLTMVLAVQMIRRIGHDRPDPDPARQGRRHGRGIRQRRLGSLFGASGSANFMSRTTGCWRRCSSSARCCWPTLATCARAIRAACWSALRHSAPAPAAP
jgi:hypothetical protein